ncbi:lycopene cyclase family protein [Actinokineospora globicatena]|uniref:lycopene cyclase family protein n=1 Tax=Actinokineospora globicatena TaxID=103729 RepID=UPI0032DB50A5
MSRLDVVVVGGGPAGWAVADACARAGLATAVVAPGGRRVWSATFGVWADQVPADRYPGVLATRVLAAGRVIDREYLVLDNAAVCARLWRGPAVSVDDEVVGAEFGRRGATVRLASGRRLACAVVIDASGARRVVSGGPAPGVRVAQTAYGVVVPSAVADGIVRSGDAVLMDWGRPPTFLYAVGVSADRVLLEETSLAARPGTGWDELRRRLGERLGSVPDGPVERVRFPVDLPPTPPWHRGSVPFGAAAGMVHPATGYSVGDALATAPLVAEAIASAFGRGPVAAAAAGRAAVWSPRARVVHAMRSHGLRALLALPPEGLAEFFDVFFALSPRLQRAYLSGREDVAGTAAAMAAVFGASRWGIRGKLLLSRHSPPG